MIDMQISREVLAKRKTSNRFTFRNVLAQNNRFPCLKKNKKNKTKHVAYLICFSVCFCCNGKQ